MNTKSFLFIRSWMEPLRTLPPQQRWNVLEAIAEYSTSGKHPESLDAMEAIAFGFIRIEIDRMKHHRNEVCAKRCAAANTRLEKKQPTAMQAEAARNLEDSDAKACNAMHTDAPYDIISESKSESESVSDNKSSSTSGVRVCVRENAGLKISRHTERCPQPLPMRPSQGILSVYKPTIYFMRDAGDYFRSFRFCA